MPLYDYHCEACGKVTEILVSGSSGPPNCSYCGSSNVNKLMSAHSSLSGAPSTGLPGAGDTGCCGSRPHQADCQGTGSCCGTGH
ncbi:MAG: zinc ribbon domain-containing protein [Deltaproteobacteria bacterium]|nr:zinc ribbon domain-containing protein [Deltaproteobacteria bacterium]MBW2483710.1 zinc ribbon domain-containing protein [Deltaproteobacteria bacterium]